MGRIDNRTSQAKFVDDCFRVRKDDTRFKLMLPPGRVPFLRGKIDVVDNGATLNQFDVEIHWKAGYPFTFPILIEIGGKIPRVIDWHIHAGGNDSCCLTVPMEEYIHCVNGLHLETFIDTHATFYLYNQAHRLIYGYYADKEYSHNSSGPWEFYYEFFNTKDRRKIIRHMSQFAEKKMTPKTICYCGSGEKMSKCHSSTYSIIRGMSPYLLFDELLRLRSTQ